MKKLLSLLFMLAMCVTVLASCGDEPIGSWLENFPKDPPPEPALTLNMYIITGDNTTADAKVSVSTRIAGYTKAEYNTTLNVHYVTASEYESTVKNAIDNGGKTDSAGNVIPQAHIILISSEAMINGLVKSESGNKLCDLTGYYSTKAYGRLNTQIAKSLIQSSRIDGRLYSVPNNRVVGEYTYLVVNKEVAVKTLHYTNEEILEYKSLEDAAELMAEMTNAGYNAAELVRVVRGNYQLREELSKEGFCNVIDTPSVTSADAFSSAFAIVNTTEKYNDCAMKMIYAINTDTELRDILQYGVLGANYTVEDGTVTRIKDGSNVYDMNIYHTGDLFKSSYCEEFGWSENIREYGLVQNRESKSI